MRLLLLPDVRIGGGDCDVPRRSGLVRGGGGVHGGVGGGGGAGRVLQAGNSVGLFRPEKWPKNCPEVPFERDICLNFQFWRLWAAF